jgi:hypothetical protein
VKGDSKSKRLRIHTEISMVHGGRPRIFLAWEDIASDPNLTCEVLYRTLVSEFERRSVRPPILYLQLDNCIRENKNTVFISYLCWILERDVFKEIYLSFLPVGHTHFDCDQCASCIGTAVKYKDITSVESLMEMLSHCYSPKPEVSFIEAVADVTELMNPAVDGKYDNTFPGRSSRVVRARGCATKQVQAGREVYMDPTSPLHWRIRKDTEGKVFLQTQLTCDDDQWSEQTYMWTKGAPRPNNREFTTGMSGLEPQDLECRPPKPLSTERAKELAKAMDRIRPPASSRMTVEDMDLIDGVVDKLRAGTVSPIPAHGWRFPNEGLHQESDVEEDEAHLYIRAAPRLYPNLNIQNIAREQRRRRGRAANELVISRMVALSVFYTTETPASERSDFWVGKILDIDTDERKIHVKWWHTGPKRNLSTCCTYRVWAGTNAKEWMSVSRVLAQFEFNAKNRIISAVRNSIKNAIQLNLADEQADEQGEP